VTQGRATLPERTRGITVGVKTFLRTPKLRMCLESLAAHPWHEVIVADDGPVDAEREQLYAEFSRRLPLRLLRLPFDTGLAAGRNEIVRQCGTEYLLVLDDDQTVPDNIGVLAEVLDDRPELGGVSCVWLERSGRKCTACDIRVEGRKVIKEVAGEKPVLTTAGGRRYVVFDFIPNSTLFRLACLRDQSWDPYYKIGKEHLDFYLAHRRLGRWKFAVSLDVVIGHHPEGQSADYGQFRHGERVRASEKYFLEKFAVTEVVEGRKYIDEQGGVDASAAIRSRWQSLRRALARLRGGT
jgi:glycosyltransferase involved in cell wall biosynthesis